MADHPHVVTQNPWWAMLHAARYPLTHADRLRGVVPDPKEHEVRAAALRAALRADLKNRVQARVEAKARGRDERMEERMAVRAARDIRRMKLAMEVKRRKSLVEEGDG